MPTTDKFSDAITNLKRIQSQLVSISNRTDNDRMLELVKLRRALAVQIGTVSNVAESSFLKTATDEEVRQFRTLLSAMRRAIALHQADFPAVKLDQESAAFHFSAKSAREASSMFTQWIDGILARR